MAPSTATSDFSQKYGAWTLVTGASSGIGAQFARSLAARGLNVILTARRTQQLNDLASELESKHSVKTHVLTADLTQPGAASKLAAEVSTFDIGLFINNAGVESTGLYIGLPVPEVEQLVALNVAAVSVLARLIGRQIAERKRGGGVIFVSSCASRPSPYGALYASSKAFVSTLSVSLRYEMAEFGVDVLAFEPGFVKSDMADRVAAVFDPTKFGLEIMETEETVEECVRTLGGRPAVCTPGWKNRLTKFFMDYLPRATFFPMYCDMVRKTLPAEKTSL